MMKSIDGAERRLEYSYRRIDQCGEEFLDALGIPSTSPVRQHIRAVVQRPEMQAQLEALYDALHQGREDDFLVKEDIERFSNGIQGHVHILLQARTRVPLVAANAEDLAWLDQHFDTVFTPETPMNRLVFPSFAKLVLLRRVGRTLLGPVGLQQMQRGLTTPLVINLTVDLGRGEPLYHLHTVTPTSAPSSVSGERLGSIVEPDGME